MLHLIAWPCVIESYDQLHRIASHMQIITKKLWIDYYFKSSFDKANRSSLNSYRWPGFKKWLNMLQKLKQELWVKICTDIHSIEQVKKTSQVADILQLPAFLCRQTDLIIALAETGKQINIKKWQFMSPWDMKNVVNKFTESWWKKGNLILTERGTSFGYNNLVVDMRGLVEMQKFHKNICFDATHSTQLPWGMWTCSGGDRSMAFPLAKAAATTWIDWFFFETHFDPENAKCDGPNMIFLDNMEWILKTLLEIWEIVA